MQARVRFLFFLFGTGVLAYLGTGHARGPVNLFDALLLVFIALLCFGARRLDRLDSQWKTSSTSSSSLSSSPWPLSTLEAAKGYAPETKPEARPR